MIFALVAACHLVVFTHFGSSTKPKPPATQDDAAAMTVDLLPTLAHASPRPPSAPKAAPSAFRPIAKQALIPVAEVETNIPPVLAEQLAPVSLTAQPAQLSASAEAAPSTSPLAAITQAQGEACDFTGPLQSMLQGSPAVLDELSHIPRQARSVANAIMLWDGHWAALETPGYPVMGDPLHLAILGAVRALPPSCLGQAVAGPRLLTIADPDGTTVIALGSGTWRWGDLLSSEVGDSL